MSNLFIWEYSQNSNLYREILEFVEPYDLEREVVIKCIEYGIYYRPYIAKDNNCMVVAIAISRLLLRTQTLYIEDFTLHPYTREKGYAKQLWND